MEESSESDDSEHEGSELPSTTDGDTPQASPDIKRRQLGSRDKRTRRSGSKEGERPSAVAEVMDVTPHAPPSQPAYRRKSVVALGSGGPPPRRGSMTTAMWRERQNVVEPKTVREAAALLRVDLTMSAQEFHLLHLVLALVSAPLPADWQAAPPAV